MDKEAFLKPALPERYLGLSVGRVKVRGLSRAEHVSLQALKDDLGALERSIVQMGLVEPPLTLEEVATWYASALSDDVDAIVAAVSELSGTSKGSPKSGVPGVPGEPGT